MNLCGNCGAPTKNQKFCSRSCSVTVTNSKNKKKHGQYAKERPCRTCSKTVNSGYALYCSHECHSKWLDNAKIQSWLDGTKQYSSEYNIPKFIRRFLLEEANFRCSSKTCCVPGGWGVIHPTTGKSPLTIDHINGDATNNTRENLRVLCPNCHSLTETYGALNKGNGRTYRYKNQTPVLD